MVCDRGRCAVARGWGVVRSAAAVAGLGLAMLLGGCATEAQHSPRGATVAFESIDGPPRDVFDRLVASLDAEAQARRVAVVSRRAPARYRVRAYLAAKVEPNKRTAIAWVLDVYDSDLRRAFRIAGEEPAGGSRPDAWAAADAGVLTRIAEAGMARLAEFTTGSGAAAPAEAPAAAPEPAEPEPATPPANDVRVADASPAMVAAAGRAR